MITTSLCVALLAAGAAGVAVWNHLQPDMYAEWLTDGIAVAALIWCGYAIASVGLSRTILHGDRIELISVFRRRLVLRADIIGYRIGPAVLKLARRGGDKDVAVTQEVLANAAWVAWLETLVNLDERDGEEARTRLEADEALGLTPSARRETAQRLSRWAGGLTWISMALAGWLIFWPRPYALAIVAGALAPLAAIAIVARWRNVFSVLDETESSDVTLLYLLPGLAVGIRALFDVQMLDWQAPLVIAVGLSLATTGGLVWLDARGRTLMSGVFNLVLMLPWGWGCLVFSNVLLDSASQQTLPVQVVAVTGKSEEPAVTVETGSGERFSELEAPRSAPEIAKVGARACLVVRPGRWGWRYGYVVGCGE